MGYLSECPTITLGNPPDRGAPLDKGVKILKEIVVDSSNIKVHKTRSSKDENIPPFSISAGHWRSYGCLLESY